MDEPYLYDEPKRNNNGIFILAIASLIVLAIVFYVWSN